jgi:putative ABC transport system permease protein
LLGGDLLLLADHPWDPAYRREATGSACASSAESASFPSMTSANGASQLADIKAVEPGYPLRGSLRTAPALNQPDAGTKGRAAPGAARCGWTSGWPAALGAKVGDRVRLSAPLRRLGHTDFGARPRRELLQHRAAPDDAMPTTAGHAADPGRQPGRLAPAPGRRGEGRRRLPEMGEARLGRGERLESLDNARPEVRNALDRAEKFLRLAALLAAVLAAVAVGLAARRFMQRHLDGCAVMRCLGARDPGQLLRIFLGEFLLFGAIASARLAAWPASARSMRWSACWRAC